jgi:hypothetical protein
MRQRMRNAWFQQDWPKSHVAKQSMTFLRGIFSGRLISRFGDMPWPALSPDSTAPDIFLWRYLGFKVRVTRPHSTQNWKTALCRKWEQLKVIYCRKLCRYSDSDYSMYRMSLKSSGTSNLQNDTKLPSLCWLFLTKFHFLFVQSLAVAYGKPSHPQDLLCIKSTTSSRDSWNCGNSNNWR